MKALHELTDAEIDAMKADEWADALVAENVMGWRWCPSSSSRHSHFLAPAEAAERYDPSQVHRTADLPKDARPELIRTPPEYFTDIAAAWEVVEKLGLSIVKSEDGWYAIKPADIVHPIGEANPRLNKPALYLVGNKGEQWTPAETAPLAICRCALRVARRLTS